MNKPKGQPSQDKEKVLNNLLSTNQLGDFFGVPQSVLDYVWEQLTAPEGNSVTYISMEIGADMDVFNPVKNHLKNLVRYDS